MGRRLVTAAVALAVGAVVGWQADAWLEKLFRAIDDDRAIDRHLQAVALVNEVEARWGPPGRWGSAGQTRAKKDVPAP